MRGQFTEACPHCLVRLDYYGAFEVADYADEFKTECTECGRTIWVAVHSVPEFEVFKDDPSKPPAWIASQLAQQQAKEEPNNG